MQFSVSDQDPEGLDETRPDEGEAGDPRPTTQQTPDIEILGRILCDLVAKAHRYAAEDPKTALTKARESAEAILLHVFAQKHRSAKKLTLEPLIQTLAKDNLIPDRLVRPLKTIQDYGNFGSHAQLDAIPVSQEYIYPSLSALATVTHWFFVDYLKTPIPKAIEGLRVDASDRKRPDSPPVASIIEIHRSIENRVRAAIQLNADQRMGSKILAARIDAETSRENGGAYEFSGIFKGEKPLWFYPLNYTGKFKGFTCDTRYYDIRELSFTSIFEKLRFVAWVDVRQEFIEQVNQEMPLESST
jgi:hypothetical protein